VGKLLQQQGGELPGWRKVAALPFASVVALCFGNGLTMFACPNRIERAASPTGTSVTSTKTYSVSNPSSLRIIDGPVKVRMGDGFRQWDLFIAGDGHQHAAERFEVRPEVAKIANIDRAPFPRFDHGADVFPANLSQEGVLGSGVMCHRTGRSHRSAQEEYQV